MRCAGGGTRTTMSEDAIVKPADVLLNQVKTSPRLGARKEHVATRDYTIQISPQHDEWPPSWGRAATSCVKRGKNRLRHGMFKAERLHGVGRCRTWAEHWASVERVPGRRVRLRWQIRRRRCRRTLALEGQVSSCLHRKKVSCRRAC